MFQRITIASLVLGLALAVGMAFYAAPASAANVVKIGVFDLQRVINQSKKGQAAEKTLRTKYERIQKELKRSESELERLQKELESQGAMLSPDAKHEKEKTLKRKLRDFQDKYRDYTEEMKKVEYEKTQPIVDGILRAATQIGKEKGYTLILEAQKAGVIYAPDALDITDVVIKRFDSGK